MAESGHVSLAQGKQCTRAIGSEVVDNGEANKGDADRDADDACCGLIGIAHGGTLGFMWLAGRCHPPLASCPPMSLSALNVPTLVSNKLLPISLCKH
jgi:hypothetical protein